MSPERRRSRPGNKRCLACPLHGSRLPVSTCVSWKGEGSRARGHLGAAAKLNTPHTYCARANAPSIGVADPFPSKSWNRPPPRS